MKLSKFFILLMVIFFFIINIFSYKSFKKSLSVSKKNRVYENWNGTYSVLLLRIEFQEDDNIETTGDGTFKYRSETDLNPVEYDYYKLFDLVTESNSPFVLEEDYSQKIFPYYNFIDYMENISNGNFQISDIHLSDIYQLNRKMAYYGENDKLAELAVDTLDYIRNNSTENFGDYDFVFIIHAGYGEEFDTNYDTEKDIVSGVVKSEDLNSAGYNKDFINDYNFRNDGVIIIPESEAQDFESGGYPPSLLGPVAFSFCSYLGMKPTYDISQYNSGVGFWDLMSWGWISYSGHVPTHPLGVQKYKMGWIDNVNIYNANGTKVVNPDTLNKFLINKNKNIYVEYRNLGDKNIDNYDYYLWRYQFEGSTTENDKILYLFSESSSNNRDGLLIYEVNENLLNDPYYYYNASTNRLKIIDIKQADGMFDLNKPIGQTGSFGDKHDLFNDGDYFTRDSVPNTRINNKITGINVENIQTESSSSNFEMNNLRSNYFPKINQNITKINNNFYVLESGDIYSIDDQMIGSIDNENILFLFKKYIFTNENIYQYENSSIQKIIELNSVISNVIRNNDYFILQNNSSSKIYYYDELADSFNFYKSFDMKINDFYFTNSNEYYISDNVLYNNGIVVDNGITATFFYNNHLYYLKNNMLYRYQTSSTFLFKFEDDYRDFIVFDFDNDNVKEVFVSYNERIIIYNSYGDIERVYSLKNVDYLNIITKMKSIYLLALGKKAGIINLKNDNIESFIGNNVVFNSLEKNEIIYFFNDIYYSFNFKNYDVKRNGNYIEEDSIYTEEIQDKKYYLYPNPCKMDNIKLKIYNENSTKGKIVIFNEAMQKIHDKSYSLHQGENDIIIDVSDFKFGNYLLYFKNREIQKYFKFSVIK